jgi:hypothetical protein
MKHHLLKASVCWLVILLSVASYGQEIPLGALPMQYNSSFAGEADGPRISSNLSLQTPRKIVLGMGNPNIRYGLGLNTHTSYDQFISKIRSGIGVSVNYNNYPGNSFNSSNYGFSLAIAPKFSLNGKYTLSPSLDFSYNSGRSVTENWLGSNEQQIVTNDFLQSRIALLLNTQKWYIGYSVTLFQNNQVTTSIDTGVSDWSFNKYVSYWQLGYTFQRSSDSRFSFTPQLVFLTGYQNMYNSYIPQYRFRYFRLMDYNLAFRYQKFIWGLNNAGIMVGIQTKQTRLILTNGFEGLNKAYPSYTAQLSFRYVFKKDK